jgi:hypothetical protein
MDADLIDPVTDDVIARSNRIILTTASVLILKHTFADGSSTFTGNAPFTVGLVATVFDATNGTQPGLDVRWTIVSDGTLTQDATLSRVHGTTDASGRATSSLRLLSVGTVTVRAALFDASNTEIVGLTITAIGQ